ncbi:UDP-glucose 6-dehydrogenase [Amycolatopsis thailandensis]|uniref:UDP-glucose 6-dehydrogenase n=1 Tax=Amycolatopsis thailandensis TaxID=589330 RepID=A0A229SFG9_9PSEU|nr:UDP-glucose/GDP-mannose dehydrogenase family protein [Amycolatopsis thailandensis]OXM57575.1 UDP-glucose 6-dehydrogenase [Amycolatopsis thailandensis]
MTSPRVVVIGTGYVGLTTGACLASLGHAVVCADADQDKVDRLARGRIDILEPGLAELVTSGTAAGRLTCVGTSEKAFGRFLRNAEIVFLCVPTPMGAGGLADLGILETVVRQISELLPPGCTVVTKSTVPVGTATRLTQLLRRDDVSMVSNPEFLREGNAVRDFLHPDRVVVGSADREAAEQVASLYASLNAPIVLTDAASAELIKYAANCFLAVKLSYANAIAELCDRAGADVADVAAGMGFDRRIGKEFLAPGPGWGGSCLPKDTSALLQLADSMDFEFRLVRAAIDTNIRQHKRVVDKIREVVTGTRLGSMSGVRLALLGLTFKAGTNDLRDSPALAVAALLREAGAELVAYDPAVDSADSRIADLPFPVTDDPHHAARGADAIVVLTEWPEFRELDWHRLATVVRTPVVVDTRNLLDASSLSRAGFGWTGLGKPPRSAMATVPPSRRAVEAVPTPVTTPA